MEQHSSDSLDSQDRNEQWLPVPGYIGIYEVSDMGRIRGLLNRKGRKAGRFLGLHKATSGGLYVALSDKGRSLKHFVHRLVMLAFNPSDDLKLDVVHLNGLAEDNRLENLSWATHSEATSNSKRHVNPTPKAKTAKPANVSIDDIFAAYDTTGEQWRDVPDYDGLYQVSSAGRVKATTSRKGVKAGYIIRGYTANRYHYVFLSKDGKSKRHSVHRLVMQSFAPYQGKERVEVNHIDANPANNRLENLEWVTRSENILHAIYATKTMGIKRGQDLRNTSLVDDDIRRIRQLYNDGMSQATISEMYGMSQVAIHKIVRRKSWTHIE